MNLQIFRVDGVPFVVSPYQPGMHIREDVFHRQLSVTCVGQIEYPEDVSVYGTYRTGATLYLGRCGLISDAIALAATHVAADEFPLDEDSEALSFSSEFIEIHDEKRRLVLAGRVGGYTVDWIEPVASSAEVIEIRKKLAELYHESSFERSWDNFSTAGHLDKKARALEGRLVDTRWRTHARLAISATRS